MKTPTPEINKAFYAYLLSAMPISSITSKDIAWPNVAFKPSLERMYIEPKNLFAETETASLSPTGFERLTGIFQMTVYGLLNRGENLIDEVARELTDIFRGGGVIPVTENNPVHIMRTYRSQLHMTEIRPVVAVSVTWVQYTQKGE